MQNSTSRLSKAGVRVSMPKAARSLVNQSAVSQKPWKSSIRASLLSRGGGASKGEYSRAARSTIPLRAAKSGLIALYSYQGGFAPRRNRLYMPKIEVGTNGATV